MIWLAVVGLLVLLGLLPMGITLGYQASGPWARLLLGPVKISLYPRKPKKKKPPKGSAPEQAGKTGQQSQQDPPEPARPGQPPLPKKPQPPREEKPSGGSVQDFFPFLRLGLELLSDLRRKLRVEQLQLHWIMAGEDPCDLAVGYGKAWAAVSGILSQLERMFVIRHRDVTVSCDFAADCSRIYARLDVTLTLGRLLSLAVVYGIRALRMYLQFSKKRKGGVVNDSQTS